MNRKSIVRSRTKYLTPGKEPAKYSFESSSFIGVWFCGQQSSSLHLKHFQYLAKIMEPTWHFVQRSTDDEPEAANLLNIFYLSQSVISQLSRLLTLLLGINMS